MTQYTTGLITDSTCDLPPELAERYGILVQSHVIIWNGQQYRDKTELLPEEFYRRLKSEPVLPTTSQASVHDFAALYRRSAEQGAKEIVAITVSGALSGAYQSEGGAAREVEAEIPVWVHDSRAASMNLGWQALAAARVREAGGGSAEMLAAAERVRRNVYLFICLDTLEYVYRGGRIGNAGRLIGSMLNIKPMITVDHDSGIVEPVGMAMTRKKAIDQMIQKFFSKMEPGRPVHVAVMHGDAEDDARVVMERIARQYSPAEMFLNITGPALGINTGPGAIALSGYSD